MWHGKSNASSIICPFPHWNTKRDRECIYFHDYYVTFNELKKFAILVVTPIPTMLVGRRESVSYVWLLAWVFRLIEIDWFHSCEWNHEIVNSWICEIMNLWESHEIVRKSWIREILRRNSYKFRDLVRKSWIREKVVNSWESHEFVKPWIREIMKSWRVRVYIHTTMLRLLH